MPILRPKLGGPRRIWKRYRLITCPCLKKFHFNAYFQIGVHSFRVFDVMLNDVTLLAFLYLCHWSALKHVPVIGSLRCCQQDIVRVLTLSEAFLR